MSQMPSDIQRIALRLAVRMTVYLFLGIGALALLIIAIQLYLPIFL